MPQARLDRFRVHAVWEPEARRLLIFEEHSANKKLPEETGKIMLDSLTYADERGSEPYYHDQIIWCDDTPDSKIQMAIWRRDLGLRVHPARKARMRRLSYEWLAWASRDCHRPRAVPADLLGIHLEGIRARPRGALD